MVTLRATARFTTGFAATKRGMIPTCTVPNVMFGQDPGLRYHKTSWVVEFQWDAVFEYCALWDITARLCDSGLSMRVQTRAYW